MARDQSLPSLWLISDARNDAGLERALTRLPRGGGFIYRHYHLDGPQRLARFRKLRQVARACGHQVILADSALTAREWGADGVYGPPRALYPRRCDLIQLATAHNLREIGHANQFSADAVLLSPVFPTRSHPGGKTLGTRQFLHLAAYSHAPVIALGGMNSGNARTLKYRSDTIRWAAIDGLS